jgi:two-component system, NtrC family, sensor histidine kinase KinB
MLVTVAPIPEFQDRQPALVIVFDDVTELARLDELRSELVAVASHELKTPLTTLRMNLLMLQEQNGQLPPAQQEMLQAAITGTDDLAATIEEMLDLTRIESGQLQLRRERVDLGALLDEAVRSLQPRFDDAGIVLSTHRELGEHLVWGDAARLKLVFTNLLGNALKYTPRGGRVTVALERVEPADDNTVPELELTVTDEGPGVPPEFRERIFEKFFRVEHHVQEREHPPADASAASSDSPSTSSRSLQLSRKERTPHGGVRGTGIGLFLCRQIIEAHHGRIWCEPSPSGNGSCFTFRMLTGPAGTA